MDDVILNEHYCLQIPFYVIAQGTHKLAKRTRIISALSARNQFDFLGAVSWRNRIPILIYRTCPFTSFPLEDECIVNTLF